MTNKKREVCEVPTSSRVWNPRTAETTEAKLIRMRRVVFVLLGNLSFILLVRIMRKPETMIVTVVRYPTTFSLSLNGLRVTSIKDIMNMKGKDVRAFTIRRKKRFLSVKATQSPSLGFRRGVDLAISGGISGLDGK